MRKARARMCACVLLPARFFSFSNLAFPFRRFSLLWPFLLLTRPFSRHRRAERRPSYARLPFPPPPPPRSFPPSARSACRQRRRRRATKNNPSQTAPTHHGPPLLDGGPICFYHVVLVPSLLASLDYCVYVEFFCFLFWALSRLSFPFLSRKRNQSFSFSLLRRSKRPATSVTSYLYAVRRRKHLDRTDTMKRTILKRQRDQ